MRRVADDAVYFETLVLVTWLAYMKKHHTRVVHAGIRVYVVIEAQLE